MFTTKTSPLTKKGVRFCRSFEATGFRQEFGMVGQIQETTRLVRKDCIGGKRVNLNVVSGTVVLKKIFEEYIPDNIVNIDKICLFFKYLSNKTLTFDDDNCHGGKNIKEGVTSSIGSNTNNVENLRML